ncbi:hypothetical protein DFS34DRAFT_626675 [Phlyctochytrium arcticum]|nr:hypothetical protein DFS34DRAFT_626675 [Phlyctochytrium arcticum]
MPAIRLAVKGCSPNDSEFAPFAELDTEADFASTWKICTKVKGALENGDRLENLSWRAWHLRRK